MHVKIPLRISPFFWLTSAVIGWLISRTLLGTLIWIAIIFVSILVHEYGHALTARFFGQFPRIDLVAFGGLTYPEGPPLKLWKEFIVVLNGPLFGFGLYLIGSFLLTVPSIATSVFVPYVQSFTVVNLFWTILNLLPVLPLDGGQLMRIILESILGVRGLKAALVCSLIFAVLFSGIAFAMSWYLPGAFFILFAMQNVQSWKVTKVVSNQDQSKEFQDELIKAEECLICGKVEEAVPILEKVRSLCKEGILFITATQYLARIKFQKKQYKEAHDLLLEIKKNLSDEFLVLLHFVAFEVQDYTLVKELSSFCYQKDPSLEVALRNAIAAAYLDNVKEVVGWLEASIRGGLDNVDQIILEKAFDKVRNHPEFIEFAKDNKKA